MTHIVTLLLHRISSLYENAMQVSQQATMLILSTKNAKKT